VLTVIYLVFNEGYAPTRGEPLVRTDLCAEAIRLGRVVRMLMAPRPPVEATALVALLLLHDSRRDARLDAAGELVLLEDQDRRRWDHRRVQPSPIVSLNRAVAVTMVDGPGPALALATNDSERRFLERRLRDLQRPTRD
jgi:predicted RNA polymerase sigma factor